jgi:hypothetical protein
MKLTEHQRAALAAASQPGGLFQLPERRSHSPAVLATLVKRGWLKAEKVGVVWSITAEGKQALLQNEAAPGK